MTQIYSASMGIFIRDTNFGAQKIDRLTLVSDGIVIARFFNSRQAREGLILQKNLSNS